MLCEIKFCSCNRQAHEETLPYYRKVVVNNRSETFGSLNRPCCSTHILKDSAHVQHTARTGSSTKCCFAF